MCLYRESSSATQNTQIQRQLQWQMHISSRLKEYSQTRVTSAKRKTGLTFKVKFVGDDVIYEEPWSNLRRNTVLHPYLRDNGLVTWIHQAEFRPIAKTRT